MNLTVRDKRALILGSIVIVVLLAFLLWPRGETQTNVELVPAAQRPAAATAAPPPAPIPVQTVTATPAPAPAAAAGGVPQGLTLTGITGSGAIFAFQDGSQRYIVRGRDVAPGLTLQGLALRHVVLAAGPASYRLGFGGAAIPIQAPGAAASLPAAAGPALVVPGSGRNAMGGPLLSDAQHQQISQQYVRGLQPRRQGARITGWTVQQNGLMGLSEAGLQPGDVLVSFNGEAIEEQGSLMELSRRIADSSTATFEFERNGQRMRRAIQVNPRR